MPTAKSDIRIIEGDAIAIADSIKHYLSDLKFKIDKETFAQKNTIIESSNLQRSFVKLYLTNSPQIVHWQIEQKPNNQVQIEVSGHLFKKYRIQYYLYLNMLLTGFCIFAILSFSVVSADKMKGFYASAKFLIIGISFLLLSVFYIFKSIDYSSHFENFKDNIYMYLTKSTSRNELIIKNNTTFPEIWPTFFLFWIYLFVALISGDIKNYIFSGGLTFINGLCALSIPLIFLLILLVKRSDISPRMIFLLVGVGFCIPLAVYMNGPIFLLNELITLVNDGKYIIEKLETPSSEVINIFQRADMDLSVVKQDVKNILIGVFLLLSFVSFFAFALIFQRTIRLPIKVINNLSKFESMDKKSYYNKSLHPSNADIFFNSIIFILWLFLAIVNMIGLFLLFSIFEKLLVGDNVLFISPLTDQFFYNTEVIFMLTLSPYGLENIGFLIHKGIMFLYAMPVIILFILVFRKNLISITKNYNLLKDQVIANDDNNNKLLKKTVNICEFAKVKLPVIRIIESPDISAEVKYIGFPVFKNILVISEGTWQELESFEDELDALIAHEIWHIKKHTLARRFLCFLSDYSLFGNGFLALIQNSFQMEKEADDFSVRWLTKRFHDERKAARILKSLLEKIEEIDLKNSIFKTDDTLKSKMLKDGAYRNRLLKRHDNSPRLERLKIKFQIFFRMYFGEEIISYFHPSINQRIEWVERNYDSVEAN